MPRFHNLQDYNHLRKDLRNNLTKPEVILWYYLKDRGLASYKFRRQHGIGRYIVDFYCPRLKLAIELDGGQHYEQEAIAYDKERDAFISSLGIHVVRIPNNELLGNKEGVFEYLVKIIKRQGRLFDHLPASLARGTPPRQRRRQFGPLLP
jgi:very-short-patch-repair endonuclease